MATQKVTITLDADLVERAKREAPGGNLSAHVAAGLEELSRREAMRRWVATWEAEHGPVTAAEAQHLDAILADLDRPPETPQ